MSKFHGCCSACNGTGNGDANGSRGRDARSRCRSNPSSPVDQSVEERREAEDRCQQCGNYLVICGHNLSFTERMKTVRANYIGWSETR